MIRVLVLRILNFDTIRKVNILFYITLIQFVLNK